MKKNIILIALGAVLALSCSKEKANLSSDVSEIAKSLSLSTQNILTFNTFDEMIEFSNKINKLPFKEQNSLSNWTLERNGFVSMKMKDEEISAAFSLVTNKREYDAFMSTYSTQINITPDNSIRLNGYFYPYAAVLNTEGEVLIGNFLYKFTDKHIFAVEGYDKNKMKVALSTLRTNSKEGIYVSEISLNTKRSTGLCSDKKIEQECSVGSPQSHRMVTLFEIFPLPNNEAGNSACPGGPTGVVTFRLASNLDCNLLSEKRGFLSLWYRHRTTMQWSMSWGAQGDPAVTPYTSGGTGWTVNDVSEINYSTSVSQTYCNSGVMVDNRFRYNFQTFSFTASIPEISYCAINFGER